MPLPWRTSSGRRRARSGWKASTKPLPDYADAAAYVFIAEPGARKTAAFKTEAATQGGKYSTVRELRTLDKSEWHDKTLFLDGLVEARRQRLEPDLDLQRARGRPSHGESPPGIKCRPFAGSRQTGTQRPRSPWLSLAGASAWLASIPGCFRFATVTTRRKSAPIRNCYAAPTETGTAMVDCDWAVLCDSIFRDEHKKLCLIGLFRQINASSVPTVHARAAVAIRLVGDANEGFRAHGEIVRPSGEQLTSFQFAGSTGPDGVAEVVVNLDNLQLPDWGIYSCNIRVGDQPPKPVTFAVLRVNSTPPPKDP